MNFVARLLGLFLLAAVPAACQVPDRPSPSVTAPTAPPRAEPLARRELPADGQDSRLAVLLHGYGSNESDLLSLARRLGLHGPIVSLRAPLPTGTGYAWFPINRDNGGTRYAPDAADAAVQRVADELIELRKSHRGEVVVIGFSQGAMLTTMLAVEHPRAIDRAVAFSGALPRAVHSPVGLGAAPLFSAHGTTDTVIPLERAREAQRLLRQAGVEAKFVEYEGMGHSISDAVVRDARNWLESVQ